MGEVKAWLVMVRGRMSWKKARLVGERAEDRSHIINRRHDKSSNKHATAYFRATVPA